MENDFFTGLFAYNHNANSKVIDCFEQETHVAPRAFALMGHILQVHRVWLNRTRDPHTDAGNPWQQVDSREYRRINDELFEQTLELLKANGAQWSTQTVSYTNTRGLPFTNNLQDIYFHVINHSNYHRGQLAVLFREAGGTPPVTDYIAYRWIQS